MFGKSAFFALVLAAGAAAPATSFAQDAGVSGIRGPGSAGGLNNSVNDPSGIGNAARIPSPPPPNITAPAVPSAAPMNSTRVSPAVAPRGRIYRRAATVSRSESRRSSARVPSRAQQAGRWQIQHLPGLLKAASAKGARDAVFCRLPHIAIAQAGHSQLNYLLLGSHRLREGSLR